MSVSFWHKISIDHFPDEFVDRLLRPLSHQIVSYLTPEEIWNVLVTILVLLCLYGLLFAARSFGFVYHFGQQSWVLMTLLFVHNCLLCAFSAWTCWEGLFQIRLDSGAFVEDRLDMVTHLFFLSKISLCFLDTWVMYWMNQQPSLYQLYRQIADVLLLALFIKYNVEIICIWVTINSGVQTVRYFEKIGTIQSLDMLISYFDFIQYVVGFSLSVFFWGSASESYEQIGSILLNCFLCLSLLIIQPFPVNTEKKEQ